MPGTVFTPRQVRILKVAVIVMGVLLVGGFAFVLAAIVYQASKVGKSTVPVNAPAGQPAEAMLALPAGGKVTQMAIGEGRVVLHVEAPAGNEIVIVEAASGRVISRIRLTQD